MSFSDYVDSGSFRFGEHDLYRDFGLRLVEVIGDALQPQLRERKRTIPSRSGAYDFGARFYDERTVTLSCESARAMPRASWRELSYILSRKGRLYIFNEPDKYYIGRVYDPAQIETARFELVRFELRFICEPFAYGETIQRNFQGLYAPNYTGTAATPTRIEITNTGVRDAVGIRIMQIDKKVI